MPDILLSDSGAKCSGEKIFGLIRHGETDWNLMRRMQGQENIPLNENGIRQANDLGHLIFAMNAGWDVIVSSPLDRALRTAQTISELNQISRVIIYQQFMERDFGLASGLTRAQMHEKFPTGHVPDQESLEDLTMRVISGLNQIFLEIPHDKILLVTHGEVLRVIYRLIGHSHKVIGKPPNAGIDVVSIRWAEICQTNMTN